MGGIAGAEELSKQQCVELLRDAHVGRVVVSIGALPAALSVVFVVVDDKVAFRAARSSQLRRAAAGAVVAFHVDAWDHDQGRGWSVLVQGVCDEVTDPALIAELDACGLPTWGSDGASNGYLSIPIGQPRGSRHGGPGDQGLGGLL